MLQDDIAKEAFFNFIGAPSKGTLIAPKLQSQLEWEYVGVVPKTSKVWGRI